MTPDRCIGFVTLAATASALTADPCRAAEPAESAIAQVIVTAERRPVDLQTIPVSVAALTADDVRSSSLTSMVDLSFAVPGLSFTQQGIGATPFIRGVGSMSGAIGNESPVAVYVDGVYIAAPTAAVFSLLDVRQIEVLKGPQGTLFGRNATGGVIQVWRRDPTAEPTAELVLQRSSYSTTGASVYGSAALGDRITANITLHHSDQRRGWGTNLTTGEDTFRHENLGAAAKVVWAPTAATSVALSGSYFDRSGEDGIGYHIVPGSVGADGRTRYSGFYDSWADPQDTGGYRHEIVSARVEHTASAFRLVGILSWQELAAFFRLDQDETPARIVDAPISQYGRTTTAELQALSPDSAGWKWILGLYYLNDVAAYDPLGLEGAAVLPLSSLRIDSRQRTRSYSMYAQSTVPLTPRTHLTLGARYTRDERNIDGRTTGVLEGTRFTVARARRSAAWDKATWRLALSRELSADAMAYVSWDRGFRSGVFNLLSYADEPVFPETLDAYQVGLKSEWLDRRLRVNVAGFAYRYRNIQVESIVAGATVSVNAAAARIEGVDVDVTLVPTSRLAMKAGVALLDGEYTNFPDAPINVPNRDASGALAGGNTVVTGDATGNRTIRTPRTTATLQTTYTVPARSGRFEFGAGYTYTSAFAWDPDNRLREDASGMLTASAAWTSVSDALTVRAAAANLSGAEVSVYTVASALGDFRTPRAPRVFSLELRARF